MTSEFWEWRTHSGSFAVFNVGLVVVAVDDGLDTPRGDQVIVGSRLFSEGRRDEEGEGGSEGDKVELHGCG